MFNVRLFVCLISILIILGCGGGSNDQIAPGMTFKPPSPLTVMLPPPSEEQQIQQPRSPTCAPATGVTIYRVVTGKDYSFEQAITEMHTDMNGTHISDFVFWLNKHELIANKTSLPKSWAIGMITEQIRSGRYVIPYVNENAAPNSAHVFIIYGFDGRRILISDSNRHFGMNRFAVDAAIFESDWLINVGTKAAPEALLIFVDSHPRQGAREYNESVPAGAPMTHGDLLIK